MLIASGTHDAVAAQAERRAPARPPRRDAGRPRSSPPTTATPSARCTRWRIAPPGRAGRLRRLRARRPARHHRRARRPLAPRRPGRGARVRPPRRRRPPAARDHRADGADRARLRRGRPMKPLLLPPNQFHRFYRGGARIDALRGVPEGEDGRPEDWVGSTATRRSAPTPRASAGSRTARAARRDRGRPRGLPRPRARRALRRRPRAAGEAARRRPAPARPLPPRPRVRARAPRHALRQDRGVAHPRGRARRRRARRRRASRSTPRRCAAGCDTPGPDAMLDALHACRSKPATPCSSRPGRCTRSAPASCCSSCRSRPTCRCSSSGSPSASTTAPSISSWAGRRRCRRWTSSPPTSPC